MPDKVNTRTRIGRKTWSCALCGSWEDTERRRWERFGHTSQLPSVANPGNLFPCSTHHLRLPKQPRVHDRHPTHLLLCLYGDAEQPLCTVKAQAPPLHAVSTMILCISRPSSHSLPRCFRARLEGCSAIGLEPGVDSMPREMMTKTGDGVD